MDASPLLERMVENAPDGMAVLDPQGCIIFWNRTAEECFGYPRQAALGQRLDDWLLRSGAGGDRASPRNDGAAADAVHVFQTIARCADGGLRYVSVGVRRLGHGHGDAAAIVNLADVTPGTVRREAAMMASRFGPLLDSVPDAIVMANEIGCIVLANRQAEHVFGYAPHELVGQALEMLLPERLRQRHAQHVQHYLAQPHARPMGAGLVLMGLRKNGEEFPVEISLSPIVTEVGPLAISAIRDITPRRRVEQALEEKNVELERANRAKDRFLATMSHELRTPLNAIIGFTGLLLMRLPGPLTADQEKQLGMVQSSGQHLLSLINDLLDLAKIDAGHVEVSLRRIDARAVIDQVLTTLRPAAQARRLRLDAELPAGPLPVVADERALHQILLNLVQNAIKFTEAGAVVIEASRRAGQDGATEVGLSVVDTGVGLTAEEQSRLFSAFTRAGDARQRGQVEGAGLGLYLCRKLAELQQGRISIDSAPGRGSRFTLILRAGEPP